MSSALAAPGELATPDQVSILLDVPGQIHLTGLPASANVATPDDNAFQTGPSPAVVVLVVSVIGLVFIGAVAAAGFAVLAQRRLRALGMLSSLGATEGDVRLVMVADGAATGAVAAFIGAVVGFGAWFAYAPHLQAAAAHVVDPLAVPWPVIAGGIVLIRRDRYGGRLATRPRRGAGLRDGCAVRPRSVAEGRPLASLSPALPHSRPDWCCWRSPAGGAGRGRRTRRSWASAWPALPALASCSPQRASACWRQPPGRGRRSRSGSHCAT